MFDNKLEVGQLAMIINTRLPENRWLIGSTVVVEEFIEPEEDITRLFDAPHGTTLGLTALRSVLASGCKLTGKSLSGEFTMKDGYALFNPKNLMPIPKLKETEIQKEKELDLA